MAHLKNHYKFGNLYFILDRKSKEGSVQLKFPEPSCTKKETASIGIFTASRNDDRRIIQPTRIMSKTSTKTSLKQLQTDDISSKSRTNSSTSTNGSTPFQSDLFEYQLRPLVGMKG